MPRLGMFSCTPEQDHMRIPADAVKHNASTARTPNIPSALEGWPLVLALAELPFELPDVADV